MWFVLGHEPEDLHHLGKEPDAFGLESDVLPELETADIGT
jgi:hypothetical protein